MTFRKISLVLVLGALLSAGMAQRCLNELQAGADATVLSAPATGRDAAVYLKRAVDLLEPALPPLIQVFGDVLPADDPHHATVRFLAERKLLPAEWQPGPLTAEAWQAMLGELASWYGVTPSAGNGGALTVGDLVADLSALITEVSPRLEPVALLAAASDDQDRVAFWSIIRNDSVYPRMIVMRPPGDGVSLSGGIEDALPALSSCALPVSDFVFAPEETAQRLFLSTTDARMVIAQRVVPESQSASGSGLEYVPSGQETAYFTFSTPALDDVASYAALFVGPGVPITRLLTMIPQLRTNMSPREIIDFVSVP